MTSQSLMIIMLGLGMGFFAGTIVAKLFCNEPGQAIRLSRTRRQSLDGFPISNVVILDDSRDRARGVFGVHDRNMLGSPSSNDGDGPAR